MAVNANPSLDEARAGVLSAAFAGVERVALVGDDTHGLAAAAGGRFALALEGADALLALGLDAETLARAAAAARELGFTGFRVLAPNERDARERIRAAGLAIVEVRRVLFHEPEGGPIAGASRLERLDSETRELLYGCVLADDPRAVRELEGALERLGRELDVAAQLAVDHARTRDVERERAARLEVLEERPGIERMGELQAEAAHYRAELERLQGTRVWRLGQRWWRLRARLGGTPPPA